jgi:NADPH:quinone reductase-like Zn-dependent oxidoreductase
MTPVPVPPQESNGEKDAGEDQSGANGNDVPKQKMMKAVIYNDGSPMIVSMAYPILIPNHVLVKIRAAGANPVDAKNVFGDKDFDWSIFHDLTQKTVTTCVPGFAFSGVVLDTHPTNKHDDEKNRNHPPCPYATGDEIYGTVPAFVGSFCEYQIVPFHQVQVKPKCLSFVEAAAVPYTGLTCLQAFHLGHVDKDSHLLIIGSSGGVGHLALQYAKRYLKAKRVVGVCGTENVLFCSEHMGADHVIDYKTQNWKQELQKEVDSRGFFTCVLDCVTENKVEDCTFGYESFIRNNEDRIANGGAPMLQGKYIRLAGPPSTWTNAKLFAISLPVHAQVKPRQAISRSNSGSELFWVGVSRTSEQLSTLNNAIENYGVRPVVTHELNFGVKGVHTAFEILRGRHTRGKIVLNLDHIDEVEFPVKIAKTRMTAKAGLAAFFGE